MKLRCLLYLVLLAAFALFLVRDAMGDAVRDVASALAVALVFAVVTLAIIGVVVGFALAASLRQPPYRPPPAVYWFEYSRPERLPAERAQLAEPFVEGDYREVKEHDRAA